MTKPTIRVDKPEDGDPIGEGAERIRETRQAIYDVFPIGPEDLDYTKEPNYWPAGSMTGGQDPEVESGAKPPYDDFQDRAFLIGDQETRFDYTIPTGKNALSIGLDAGSTITVPEGSEWINIEKDDDTHVKYLRDLDDVEPGITGALDGQALIFDEDTNLWAAGTPAPGPQGPPGENGENGEKGDPGNPGADSTVPGPAGKGWTSGEYSSATGIVTFTSTDGLGFVTEDLRGEDGEPGPGFFYKGNVDTVSSLPLGANVGDAYLVEDVNELYAWGDDGSWHSLGAISGEQGDKGDKGDKGNGWASGVYDDTTGVVTFTGDADSGFLTFSTGDLRGSDGAGGVTKEYVDDADAALDAKIATNSGDIADLDVRVTQNEGDIGVNAGDIAINKGDIATNTANIATNTADIAANTGSITTNAENIALNAIEIATNASDIATNETNIAKNVVDIEKNKNDISSINAKITPGSADTIFTAVDNGDGTFGTTWAPNDHDGGVLLDNSEPWTHSQYNTLVDAPITNNGSGAPRATVDLQVSPNVKVAPSSGGAVTVCTIFSENVDKDGIYANLLLDPVATYTFDASKFVVPDVDESKWLYVRLLSEGGKWKQVGSNYLGEPGVLVGGKVLQYDFQFYNTETTTSSADWLDTGFELNFTPKTDTSRLRISASLKTDSYMEDSIRSGKTYFRIMRDGTKIHEIERGYYRNMNVSNENRGFVGWIDINYVDRPSMTSTINYKIQFSNGNTNSTVFNESQIGMFEITEIGL